MMIIDELNLGQFGVLPLRATREQLLPIASLETRIFLCASLTRLAPSHPLCRRFGDSSVWHGGEQWLPVAWKKPGSDTWTPLSPSAITDIALRWRDALRRERLAKEARQEANGRQM